MQCVETHDERPFSSGLSLIYQWKAVERPLELFKLFGIVAINNQDANKAIDETTDKAEHSHPKISGAFEKIGGAAVKVGKAVATGLAVGATAIAALTKKSVDYYSEYEQLVGGVETLFQESSARVMLYAQHAYRTAGMSANEYMETVTSFSASLLQGLGGDTAEAAEIANRAITDMSDNANKMGTDMSMIQNAYQGFAKQNYTMLDNLKLGYGGTQSEMARLINDSGVLGKSFKVTAETVNQVSFDKIIKAIGVVQDRMGITGTTAREAATTIQGSLAMTKSAWENLLLGMSDDQADFEILVNHFVDSVGVTAENIIPRIELALIGASNLIDKLFPIIIERIPQIIQDFLPKLTQSAVSIIQSLVTGLQTNKESLFTTASDICGLLVTTIGEIIPQIVDIATDLIVSFAETLTKPDSLSSLIDAALKIIMSVANGIIEALPELVTAAIAVIGKITETLTDPEVLAALLDASLEIVLAIANGIATCLPELVTAATEIIIALVGFLLEEENLTQLIDAAIGLLNALALGLVESVGILLEATAELTSALVEAILEVNWFQVGVDIVTGVGEGLLNAWDNLVTKNPFAAQILANAGNALQGGGIGDSLVGTINNTIPSHASGLDYVPYDGYIAELHKGEMVVPEPASRQIRAGMFTNDNSEVVGLLERILYALEENGSANTSIVLNNREFARLVKAVN